MERALYNTNVPTNSKFMPEAPGLATFIRSAFGAALGTLVALGLTITLIPDADLPARAPDGGMIVRADREIPDFLLPQEAAMYAPEPREKSFILLAWVFGAAVAYLVARHGAKAAGSPVVLLAALVAFVPGLTALASMALPADRAVGVALVSAATVLLLGILPSRSRGALALNVSSIALALCYIVTVTPAPVVHVRWHPELSASRRGQLEREFSLASPTFRRGTTWAYELHESSPGNLRALVASPEVDDTNDIDRVTFVVSPSADPGRSRLWLLGPVPGLGRGEWLFSSLALIQVGLFVGRLRQSNT